MSNSLAALFGVFLLSSVGTFAPPAVQASPAPQEQSNIELAGSYYTQYWPASVYTVASRYQASGDISQVAAETILNKYYMGEISESDARLAIGAVALYAEKAEYLLQNQGVAGLRDAGMLTKILDEWNGGYKNLY